MKRFHRGSIIAAVSICMCASFASGAEDEEKPTLSVSASLELFYEISDDVGGESDSDQFKSNQLYLDFTGKYKNGLGAKLKLDGADIVSGDGKVVTEKFIEEANFFCKHIGGSPFSLVFGKDEMPFGMDYDKYLNDSIAHAMEIDKVWGLHGIVDIKDIGSFAAAGYQHRHSESHNIDADNSAGDNYTAKLTVDKVIEWLAVQVSAANEAYSDVNITDATGAASITPMDNETRLSAGVLLKCPQGKGNINAEYISFSSRNGDKDYDPGLITLGAEYSVLNNVKVWGRWENIMDDTSDKVENDFWTIGVVYSPVECFQLLAEYSNFNSANMKDATDLMVADGNLDDSLLLGVKADF